MISNKLAAIKPSSISYNSNDNNWKMNHVWEKHARILKEENKRAEGWWKLMIDLITHTRKAAKRKERKRIERKATKWKFLVQDICECVCVCECAEEGNEIMMKTIFFLSSPSSLSFSSWWIAAKSFVLAFEIFFF